MTDTRVPDAGGARVSGGSATRAAHAAMAASIGGPRGLIDSSLPSVVFVAGYLAGGLSVGLWAAVGVGALLLAVRLARRESVQQAVSGFLGVAVAAFIAHRLGKAEGFFLPGIVLSGLYGVGCLISVLVRRPLVGYVVGLLDRSSAEWRSDPRLVRACTLATLAWAAAFLLRVAVQAPFYLSGHTLELAAAKLALGWPLTIAAGAVTVLLVRRARRPAPTPPPT